LRSSIADPARADAGRARIEWADAQMPVLRSVRERFERERPLEGLAVAACLHVTAETANLMRALRSGGATVALCASNPLSTQDDTAAGLVEHFDVTVLAAHGEAADAYEAHVAALVRGEPAVTIDDGADLITVLHGARPQAAAGMLGAIEETTSGLVRVRGLESSGALACPVFAVNESHAERNFNDRFGTGQSALDGIVRATHMLLAGRTVVVLGYGWTGKGIALRAKGAGASVVVCEIDPQAALEARMEGFQVMPAIEAAERGDVFITVTGGRDALTRRHFERMKDGAVLANAGHFDVEISLADLADMAGGEPREVRPLVSQYDLGDRRLNLLASGRVVNLAAAEGHPAEVMDVSFATQALCVEELVTHAGELEARVLAVPERIDREVARLKLEALGIEIDTLSQDQEAYRHSWETDPGGGR
jgi:adenosylhomocysteinase